MFRHILVPLDESILAECVLPHVSAFARLSDARTTLVRVLEPPTLAGSEQSTDPVEWQLLQDTSATYLNDVAQRLERHDVRAERLVLEGRPVSNLVAFAREQEVDLIVLSSHGQSGLLGCNLGGVGHKTLLHAHVNQLLVRAFVPADPDGTPTRYRRLLLPLDGSRRAECVLPIACKIADAHSARLLLVHVLNPPALARSLPAGEEEVDLTERLLALERQHAHGYLDGLRHHLAAPAREMTTHIVVSSDTAAALHDLAAEEGADLLVMCAHGATGSTRWPLGSTVRNMATYGTTPLLILQDRAPHEIDSSAAERAARERQGHQ